MTFLALAIIIKSCYYLNKGGMLLSKLSKGKEFISKYPLTFVNTYDQSALEARYQKAWDVARAVGEMLKTKYHASRVVVFGSLTKRNFFTPYSDIDLAAWGISDCYFKAISSISDLSQGFKIDLVDPTDCRPHIAEAIRREGVEI